RDRLGQRYPAIYGAQGTLIRDTYSVPFVTPADIPNPFEDMEPEIQVESVLRDAAPTGLSPHLFGPGYLLLQIVKTHPKGNVFLAMDVRSPDHVGLRALKQGRLFCLSDQWGRDIRDRLRHQEALARHLRPRVRTPRTDEYFEIRGHGYLPVDWVEGVSLLDVA